MRKPTVVARSPANAPAGMISGRRRSPRRGPTPPAPRAAGRCRRRRGTRESAVSKRGDVPESSAQASKYVDCRRRRGAAAGRSWCEHERGQGQPGLGRGGRRRAATCATTRPLSARAATRWSRGRGRAHRRRCAIMSMPTESRPSTERERYSLHREGIDVDAVGDVARADEASTPCRGPVGEDEDRVRHEERGGDGDPRSSSTRGNDTTGRPPRSTRRAGRRSGREEQRPDQEDRPRGAGRSWTCRRTPCSAAAGKVRGDVDRRRERDQPDDDRRGEQRAAVQQRERAETATITSAAGLQRQACTATVDGGGEGVVLEAPGSRPANVMSTLERSG